MVTSRLKFLREFITKPQSVGAVTPSSPQLAMNMVNGHDLGRARVIVELGPGTGALTQHLIHLMGSNTRFVAIEKNEQFAQLLQAKYPQVEVVHGSATHLPTILNKRGLDHADHVFSGLPWTSFSTSLQENALQATFDALRPGGSFVTFAYSAAAWLPRGRSFRRLLAETFSEVSRSSVVWANLPPAFSYHCLK